MKKSMFKLSLALLSAILITTSCGEDYEQSSFDLNQVQTKATVKGVFFYPAGMRYNSSTDAYEEIIAYPEGKRIFLDLDLTSLGGTGTKTFETRIGKDGSYSFSVPVATSGSDVTIRVEDFEADYSTHNPDVSGEVENEKIVKKTVVYTCDPSTKTVLPFSIEINNDYYLASGIQSSVEMKEVAFISGEVKACYSRFYNDVSDIEAEDKVVTLMVQYSDPVINRYYTTRTNRRGEFKVNIPLNKKNSSVFVTSMGENYVGIFRYHENNSSSGMTLNGYYYDARDLNSTKLDFDLNVMDGIVLSKPVKMLFSPYAGQVVNNSYFTSKWNSWINN